MLGSVLAAQILEPASDSVCLSVSLSLSLRPLPLALLLSLSLKINKHNKKLKKKEYRGQGATDFPGDKRKAGLGGLHAQGDVETGLKSMNIILTMHRVFLGRGKTTPGPMRYKNSRHAWSNRTACSQRHGRVGGGRGRKEMSVEKNRLGANYILP